MRCQLIGRLDSQSAEEARIFLSARPTVAVLDVTELRYADEAGLALLADARAVGVRLVGLSPYLALLRDLAEQRGAGARDPRESGKVPRGGP